MDDTTKLIALYEELYLYLVDCEQVLEELTPSELIEIRRLLTAITRNRPV